MVDDGSPVLPEWSDFEVLTELPAQRPSAKKVLFHFSNNLGRQSNLHHPGWFRSFGFAAQYAKAHQFTKIVHIESDAYLMSTRMFDFVNNSQTGWTTFWCPRWQCEEIAIQVVCEDQFDTYERITQQDYGSVYAGKVIEKMLPYTSVRKDFVGDRYAEGNGSIPLNVDYVCQFPTELEIGALVKRVKQQLSLPAPSQQGQEDVGKLFEQGLALHKQGQLVRAKMLYEAVLKKNPKHFDALNALGVAEINFENYREAVNLISSALLENKKSAEAYYNLGLGLDGLNLKAQAIEAYDECLKLDPKNFSALNNKSKTQRDIGKYEEAIVSSSAAIAIKSDYAVAYLNRAIAFMELKQFEAAIASFDQAIGIKPGNAEAYFNRGNAQMELKQFEAALASYDRAINTKPDYADAYFKKGLTLQELKQLPTAVASYDKAISVKPDFANAYLNRGSVLSKLKQLDAALDSYNKAISIKPDFVQAYSNRAVVLKDLGQIEAALASYDEAISINPDYAGVYWNKSFTLLLSGRFEEGWKLYEWRWKHEGLGLKLPNFSQPLWLGVESLQGQTILLHSEQGLGDTIQFCRYAKLVKALGAHVVMESPTALVPLLQGLEGVDELVARGQALPAFDYHCPLLSLPLAFKTELSTIPSSEPYLRSDKAKVKQWRAKLGRKTKPRVGLVWSGSTGHTNDHNRSFKLEELLPYLPDGFEYVCLQKEIREVDQEMLQQSSIQYFGDELENFADTAALCELMDVVISVDTSVAHLSGALGKPTWVLLSYSPDWRWLLDREDSPWYGSVKLYRQDADRTWSSVLQRVSRSLLSQARLPVANSVGVQQIAKNFMLELQVVGETEHSSEVQLLQLFTKGLSFHKEGQLAQAKAIYEAVLQIKPTYFDALHMLGVIALTWNDADLSVSLIGKALIENKSNSDAFFNYGLALHANAQPLSAVESYDSAISLNRDNDKIYWNKSLSLLLLGKLYEGWQLYEYGWRGSQQRGIPLVSSQPLWLGVESLQGQTILLHSEQGLGDTIQFCRYAKLVKALGAHVVMESPAALVPLLQGLEGVDELVESGQALPAFDYHCPLLSLPLAFKTELSTIPSPEPYLRSDSVKVAQWRTKLGRKTKPRIGLVWSGNPAFKGDQNRSLKLQELMPYLPEGFEYVCLQKEIREVDQETLKQSSVRYFGHELENFADTAALCELMDVVISTCSSVAHLSGALGKSTWVLLPYVPDWRWLLDREDSPWYGSVKLYRQDADRSWSSVLERVAGALLDCDKLPVASNAASSQNMTKLMAGLNSFQNGQAVQAKSILEDLLNDTPNHFDGLHLYGIVLGQLQETKKSIEIFKRAIRIKANNADIHSNLGNAYKDDRQYEQAVAHCDIAIGLNAKHFAAYTNRAIALQQLERLDEALISYDNAIALNSNNHENYLNKGVILRTLKNFDEALKSFEKTIELKSDCAEAYYNLGDAQAYLKQFETALSSYDKAISIKPDYVDAYINKGNTLQALKQFEVAVASYDRAISLQPDYAKAYYNRGNAQMALMQSEAAVDSYDKAISLKPDYAGAHWNKSLELLALGQFKEGWKSYEWRWKHEDLGSKLPNFSQPQWLGVESLQGQTILLHSEQGLGDTIQFCRYAKLVKALGAHVVMGVPAALVPLLHSLEGVDELVQSRQALPAFDYHCPLLSLPLAFKTEISTIPSPEPYLRSDKAKVNQWRIKLGPKSKPRVGLVWSGSTQHKKDHNRSLRLDELIHYLPNSFDYVCLQKEIRAVDQETLKQSRIKYFGDELKDFADTAALCELMDVVISVDTSVAHLSGALGRPTWVLLPYVPDWRWLLDREGSPWYGSVKLYRQETDRTWSTVLKRVATDLLRLS